MDPVLNPFAPGAGTPPPELAGRDELRETVRVALERVRQARPTKSVLMVGLRGVGKTVLLDRMRDDGEATGLQAMRIEAPEGRSLPALLAPELRLALLKLSRNAQAKDLAERALKGLAGFAKALKVKYGDTCSLHPSSWTICRHNLHFQVARRPCRVRASVRFRPAKKEPGVP